MTDEKSEISEYASADDETLRRLAVGIVGGTIFTSAHVRDPSLVSMVFMPLALAGQATIDSMKENDIQLLYEEYSKAGPRSINGYPIFFSMRMLDGADSSRLWRLVKQFEGATEKFASKPSKPQADSDQATLFEETDNAHQV